MSLELLFFKLKTIIIDNGLFQTLLVQIWEILYWKIKENALNLSIFGLGNDFFQVGQNFAKSALAPLWECQTGIHIDRDSY